jgi:hypothetical protein
MTKDEALKQALDVLQENAHLIEEHERPEYLAHYDRVITALREALAEQPAQQDSTCSNALRAQGKAYPRTCKKCGLGPCVELAQQALDKMAENALEQPAQKCSYPYCGCNSKAWCKVERNEALDKKAENARELGLDYEPDIPFGDNNPGLPWDEVPQAFNDWWNADYDPTGNPFEKDTHAYWAWAGWKAAEQPAQRKPLTDERIESVRHMRDVQGYDGNWNYDPYMQGLYNGLEFALSLLEVREPQFKDAPETWLGDIKVKYKLSNETEAKLKEKNT